MNRYLHIVKQRFETYGAEYLIRNIMGYPSRLVNNWHNKERCEELLDTVSKATITENLRLSGSANPELVVSVTSYPARLWALPMCIKSILLQTHLPDRLIVYLGSDTNESDIPDALWEMRKYGVEIRIDKTRNLKPHKKCFYAIQEFPEASVITVDDDLVYPSSMIEELLAVHRKYPEAVCARRVHKITLDRRGNMKEYNLWKHEYKKELHPSNALMATGCAGALYPAHSLDMRAFDADAIEKLCLNADDIWLKCMEIVRGGANCLCSL